MYIYIYIYIYICASVMLGSLRFRASNSRLRVFMTLGLEAARATKKINVQGFGLRVWGLGIRAEGLGFRVEGLGLRV